MRIESDSERLGRHFCKTFAGIHKSNDTRQLTFILLLKSCKPVLNVARFVEFLIKKIILIAIDQNADP